MIVDPYEDPEVVEGFIQANAFSVDEDDFLNRFASLVSGKQVLDLGCGPGHHSYFFAEKDCDVVGVDLSREMIRRAKSLFPDKKFKKMPHFQVGNILEIADVFSPNTFDAIWAAASLLHVEKKDISLVLQSMALITKNNGYIAISLKDGDGEGELEDTHYGKKIKRRFSFWNRQDFSSEAGKYGLEEQHYESVHSKSASYFWHKFIFQVKK